jgi:hypothetical protein
MHKSVAHVAVFIKVTQYFQCVKCRKNVGVPTLTGVSILFVGAAFFLYLVADFYLALGRWNWYAVAGAMGALLVFSLILRQYLTAPPRQ